MGKSVMYVRQMNEMKKKKTTINDQVSWFSDIMANSTKMQHKYVPILSRGGEKYMI